jgi:hypothetical protein
MFDNVHVLCQMESILQRIIKRIHIIKEFSLKNIDDMNILVTLILVTSSALLDYKCTSNSTSKT